MVRIKQVLHYTPPMYCDGTQTNIKDRPMIVVNKINNSVGIAKELQLVNVTTKNKKEKKSLQDLRKIFFNRNETDLVPIDPQHPFPCPCFAKVKCQYKIDHFDEIDQLIHYNGESVYDSVLDEIKEFLCCDVFVHFTEADIRKYNSHKLE